MSAHAITAPFMAALRYEMRIGNVSGETEQHLKHEFRNLGQGASRDVLAGAVTAEIMRLEQQAAALTRLREGYLADPAPA